MKFSIFAGALALVALLATDASACNRVVAVQQVQVVPSVSYNVVPAPAVTYNAVPSACPSACQGVMPQVSAYAQLQSVAIAQPVFVHQHTHAQFVQHSSYGGFGGNARFAGRGGFGARANFAGGAIGGTGLGGLIGDALPLVGAGIGAASGGPFGAVLGAGAGTVAKNLFGF